MKQKSRRGISQTVTVLALGIIILGAAVVYYAFLVPPRVTLATIRGSVKDETTGGPINGVTVKLDGRTVTTGQNGIYTFNVEPGVYQIAAGAEGRYQTRTLTASASEAKEYTFDFQLTPMKTFKMALLIGGDETDLGFSFMAIQGANNIREKFGWEVDISRQIPFADQARVASDYAARGYDLVVAVGGQFIQTLYFEVPQGYPNTYFAQIPGLSEPPPPQNVVALGPAFQVNGHYLAGVLSAEMTQTNSLGWICGQWFPYIAMEYYAFKAGAESVNPNIKVYARVAGTWGDASIGFQIASSLIETKNVDVIVQVADLTGRGVIAACQARNIKVIGTVADQASIAPNITLTSVLMDTPRFMELVVENVTAETFDEKMGGKPIDIDISDLAPFHQFENIVPQSTKDLLQTTRDGINSGAIQVPKTVTSEPPPDPP